MSRPSQGAGRAALAAVRASGVVLVAATAAAVTARALRTAGATDAETAAHLPGDDLLVDADVVTTRAVAVAAPPDAVWPWLVQLGWGRAGWYSLDLVERLVGAARSVDDDGRASWRSLRTIVPRHQRLAVGDLVPLGDGFGLTVAHLDPPRDLVLELDRRVGDHRLRWVWSLAVRPDGPGAARLVARTRTAITPGGVGRALAQLVLDPGHAVMELVQLRGIRDRAEAHAGEALLRVEAT